MEQLHNRIGGRKVELLIENDESSPVTAMAKVRKLIEEDKVQIIDGFVLANVGYAVAPMADKYQIPLSTPLLPVMTLLNGNTSSGSTLRLVFQSADSAVRRVCCQNAGIQAHCHACMDYQFGWEQVGGFQKAFEEAGGKSCRRFGPLGFLDFTSYINHMHKMQTQSSCARSQSRRDLPKEFRDARPKMPILAGGSAFDESFLPI